MPCLPDSSHLGVWPRGTGYQDVRGERGFNWDNTKRDSSYCLIQYSISGVGHFTDATGTHDLPAGTAFVVSIPSNTSYSLKTGETWEWVWLAMAGPVAHEVFARVNRSNGYLISAPLDSEFSRSLADIHADACRGTLRSPYRASQACYEVLMRLCDLTDTGPSRFPGPVDAALTVMDQSYDQPSLNLDRIADAVGISKYYLVRLFKAHVGQTPAAYLRERRLRHALDLVTYSTHSIKEVSSMVGFGNYAHFIASFRAWHGMSPGKVRSAGHGSA